MGQTETVKRFPVAVTLLGATATSASADRLTREDAGHRREVADVAVHLAKQRADRFLVGRDAVDVAH
jgi:hypothetical protein